ncbi:MAG: type II secretion system F family protein [Thermoleophilaceae bacterium]
MIAALAFAAVTLAVLGAAGLIGAWSPRDRVPRTVAPHALRRLAALGRPIARRPAPGDLERRIVAAGRPGGLGAREAMAAKLAAACAAAVPAALLAGLAPGRIGPPIAAALPVAAFLGPDLWLRRLASRRTAAARRELPDLVELLRVTVEAGVSLPRALATVGARARGPLAAEWAVVGREVALGVPFADALAAMAERLPTAEVRALTGALERSRRHGVPVADALAAQARDVRAALTQDVREQAARAAPKIQLVVALLLVPSVLALVAAALVAALVGGDGAAGWA